MEVAITQLHTRRADVPDRMFATNTDVVRCWGRRMFKVQSATLDASRLNGILRLEPRLVAASGVGATTTEQQFRPFEGRSSRRALTNKGNF